MSHSTSRRRRTGAAFEQDVVGYDDSRPPVHLQQGPHVLQEVELLVAGRGPEVGALHHQALPLRFPLRVDEGEAGLPSEGRIGQHHVEVDTWMGAQAVVHDNVRLVPADAVQVQIHHPHPGGVVDDLPAVKGAVSQVF